VDEWYAYSYQVLIKGEFLINIDKKNKEGKNVIENALQKFAEIKIWMQ